MPPQTCPSCRDVSSRHLNLSQEATVDYFRCDKCGHVWTADKQTHEPINHVTPLPNQPSVLR